jgi:hypothetical protein
MRLRNISTMAAGNGYAASFIGDFNRRCARPPRNDFGVHRLVRVEEDLGLIFSVHGKRQVSARLTLRIAHSLCMLTDTVEARAQIAKDVEVFEYPDGGIQIGANGAAVPNTIYDKLPVVNQGAMSRTSV